MSPTIGMAVYCVIAACVVMLGAHVLRAGVQRFLIDLMERGLITHVAMNGAGPIHDWEFALIGATTESVARYIQTGEFGLWRETGRMNEAIVQGAKSGLGLGEAIGRASRRNFRASIALSHQTLTPSHLKA